MPGGQERSENDFTSHQGSKRYPEMKPPSDLPETGDYPGHPVCGGSSLLAAWVVLGGSRRFHGSSVSTVYTAFCLEHVGGFNPFGGCSYNSAMSVGTYSRIK